MTKQNSGISTIWETANEYIGRRVEVLDQLESTNTLALQRSRDPATAGLAILAREQSAGRGQYGRQWQLRRAAAFSCP